MSARGLEAVLEAVAARHGVRLPDRRAARRRRRDPDLPELPGPRSKLSKNPEEFGKGAIEGVAGPEAANNASVAGTLVPLLSLGLPTSATAAILLAGFQQFGLNPGPLLFAENPQLVWGLIASLFIANVMLVILNLPLVGLWVQLLKIPTPWLYAGILMFAAMGSIATKGSVAELLMLLAFGVLGFLMRRHGYPVAPMVVGLILGPMAESPVAPRAADQPRRSAGAGAEPDRGDAADRRGGGAGRALRAEGSRPLRRRRASGSATIRQIHAASSRFRRRPWLPRWSGR